MDVVKEIRLAPKAFDAKGILDVMLAENPDILCWYTSYTLMLHAISEHAFSKDSRDIVCRAHCTIIPQLLPKPLPSLWRGGFSNLLILMNQFWLILCFFHNPHQFYEEYTRQFPNSRKVVSWEYVAALDIWLSDVKKADTLPAVLVLAAMKQMTDAKHVFGLAQWWGEELFGISNALVEDWPVFEIHNQKARIVEFVSISYCLERHKTRLKKEMRSLCLLWDKKISQKRRSEFCFWKGFNPPENAVKN